MDDKDAQDGHYSAERALAAMQASVVAPLTTQIMLLHLQVEDLQRENAELRAGLERRP